MIGTALTKVYFADQNTLARAALIVGDVEVGIGDEGGVVVEGEESGVGAGVFGDFAGGTTVARGDQLRAAGSAAARP